MDTELIAYLDRRFAESDRATREIRGDLDQGLHGLREVLDRRIREVHVVIEGLDSKIQTVAEGVIANGETLREFRVEVDRQFEVVTMRCPPKPLSPSGQRLREPQG